MGFSTDSKNLNFTRYFLPQKLEKSSVIPAILTKIKKKEAELEFEPFHLTSLISTTRLLGLKENQFYFYKKTPFYQGSKYSLSFQKVDFFNKELIFSPTSTKSQHLVSSLTIYKVREAIRQQRRHTPFLRSRYFSLSKKGFHFKFFGSPAFLKKNMLKNFKNVPSRSYFVNLSSFVGLLTSSFLQKWKVLPQASRRSFLNSAVFYSTKNIRFRSLVVFRKKKLVKRF